MFKWNTLCIYIVCVFLSGNVSGQTPPDDHGNTFADATPIDLDTSITGTLSGSDVDYFMLDVRNTVDVSIFTEGNIDTLGELFDSSFFSIALHNDESASNANFLIRDRLHPSIYYIVVSDFLKLTEDREYTLTVQTDDLTDIHGDTFTDAAMISLDTSITAVLHGGDVDYFALDVMSTVDVSIFTEGDINIRGILYDSSLTLIARNDDESVSNANFLIRGRLYPDIYYIVVSAALTAPFTVGAYTLTVQTDDFDLTDIHGDTFADATIISLDESKAGVLHGGDVDYFALDVSSTVDVSIFTEGDTDTVGELFDSSFTSLTLNDNESASNANFLIRGRLYPNIYYIVVRGFSAFTVGAYTLTVQTDNLTDIHGDTFADATIIGLDESKAGVLHGGDVDYFRIEEVSSTVDVSIFTEGNTNTAGRLYDGLFSIVVFNDDQRNPDDGLFYKNFHILERLYPDSGPYYIAVSGSSAFSVGAYTLTLQSENYTPFSCPPSEFDDPLYGCQWHLKNTGQSGGMAGEDINVESVWETYKGDGVHVVVVDTGMHFAHEDLKDNVDTTLNYDYTPETPLIYNQHHNHGTAVSGLIAARDENGLGVRGVAPRATIYGYNYLDDGTVINEADAMMRNRVETDVSNNSWGPPDVGLLFLTTSIWEMAIETGVNEGADGKGIVYVFAAGNGGRVGDNSNYDGYTNYYVVTAVCAVNNQGTRASYSELGANLWICAPSNDRIDNVVTNVVTTDNAHRYINDFGGTSAAAPMVSGVVALVRQANPELSWRDVKLVLAASARKNDPGNSGWQDGAVQYGAAPERYTFNHEYGFGVVDAQAAVNLAQDWKNIPLMKTAESAIMPVNQIIPDNSTTGITSSLQIASDIDFIEFVEINVDFEHPYFLNLDMRLISPAGAISELIVHRRGGLSSVVRGSWRFGSAKHLGEDSSGIWQLAVVDRLSLDVGTLNAWSLKIYGHSSLNPAVMIVFTEVLTEENLDGSELVVTITDAVWSTSLAVADFSLAGAPAGVSIMSVERNTDTTATLTLAFDGTDFDSDMAIGVTVLATAHSGTIDLVSRLITITANQETSGEPSITGTPQVGIPLTATIGSITDGNGLNTANYAWQWQVSDDGNTWTDIPGANTADFIPALIHQDQFLRVVAGFTDDDGFRESRTSTSMNPVLAPPLLLISVPTALTEANLNGSTLILTLAEAVWSSPLSVAGISLADILLGLSIADIVRNTGTIATLTLAFDGTDFDDNVEISITVLETAHSGNGNLVGEPMIIVTANHEAAGEPSITGTLRVGFRLTATTGSITDGNGLNTANYAWQWQVSDDGNTWTDIPGADTEDLIPLPEHQGEFLRVVVSFTDDVGFIESRTSTSVGPVLGPPAVLVTAAVTLTEINLDGSTLVMMITDAVWNDPLAVADFSLTTAPAGVSIMGVERNTDTTATLTLAFDGTDFDSDMAIGVTVLATAHSGTIDLVSRLITITANQEASGEPSITGTPQVGVTLTATIGGITDGNGLNTANYAWQWQVSDDGNTWTDIPGANTAGFMPALTHQDQFLRVVAGFTDDDGFRESRTSTFVEIVSNDSFATATTITLGFPINGELHSGDDVDYFRIEIASTVDVSIFTSGSIDTVGEVYDGSLTLLAFDDQPGSGNNFRILERLYPGTTYYIAVRGFSASSVGLYTLTVQMENYIPFVCPASKFDDPLYGCQWHLKNTGQNDGATAGEDINVESVWDTYKGNGIHIAVVDRGMHFAHEDLKDNMDTALNHDYTPETPSIYVHDNNHGTAVSGLIAARDNDLGVRGVAPRATIYGYNLLDKRTDINEADAMMRNRVETVVSNNSWGPPDSVRLEGATRVWEMAIETGVNEGADGKGIVYVWAGGNGAGSGDNSNYDGYANYYAVTAVCAVNDQGIRSSISEQGANLWVCAPSNDDDRGRQGIVTTDNAHRYIDNFGGTSAATSIVSGVVALVRQANPELSWRDVKLVLAASARRNDPDNSGWQDGAVQYGAAPERYTVNHEYGFGVVDAQAAVDLAQDWKNVPSMKTAASTIISVNQIIPDNSTIGITRSLQIASDIDFIEFVEINVDFDHDRFIDLDMQLISPSSAVSELIVNSRDRPSSVPTGSWRFGSARHLGEDPSGIWQLAVVDRAAGFRGTLNSWSLKIYGHSSPIPVVMIIFTEVPTEENLDGSTLVMTITDAVWSTSLAVADFSLIAAPAGVSIMGVERNTDTTATLTLEFDGTDFDSDMAISVTVLATAHSGTIDLVSRLITITANQEASGEPSITGTLQVGIPLTATTGSITDGNGLNTANYAWQWQVSDDENTWTDIPGANTADFIPALTHQNQFLRVVAGFTDDDGFRESRTSTSVNPVLAPPLLLISVPTALTEANLSGSTLILTLAEAVWSSPLSVAGISLADILLGLSIADIVRNTDTTATLTLAFDGTDFDDNAEISITVLETAHSGNGNLVGEPTIIVTANHEAVGEPSITGTPQVGVTLTATIGSITDGNGLNTANYAWQWQVSTDKITWTDIPGANTADFMPALIHQDQFLRVMVSFTDDIRFMESRASTSVGPVFGPPSVLVTVSATLTEINLDGSTLIVTITDAVWSTSLAVADFSLVAAPAGVSIMGVERNTDTTAILTLAFDGTDFDSDMAIGVTVLATAHSGTADLVSRLITITANQEASGEPSITGTPQVGVTLTATIGSITDGNGLNTTNYAWQWQVSDDRSRWIDIVGANIEDLIPLPEHQGEFLRVVLNFTDDVGFMESRASTSVGPVLGPPSVLVTATVTLTEINLDGSTLIMTITDAVWSTSLAVADFSLAGAPVGVSIMGVERNTHTTATLTLVFDGTDFDSDMAISVTVLATAHSGTTDLVSRLITIIANQEASGEPSITGTPQVGVTLMATIDSITDGNGLNTANYVWQWQVSDDRNTWTDIPGANTAEFMPALTHQDQFLRVVVSFTDDDGFRESRTSTSMNPVLAPPSLLISVPTTLTEANLNGATLIMTLTEVIWSSPLSVADFSLAAAPAGVSIMGVERNTDTTATLTLEFDGTDFDSDMAIGVTVLATAHSGTADLVSRLITITANQEASGEPSITGTPQVGVTLTATIGSITDGNGLNTANYAWQWQVSDDRNTWTDIPGANTADFMPALIHQDQFLRVMVSFTDDIRFMESRASTSVGPVLGPPSVLVTAAVTLTEINLDGSALVMTITNAVWNNPLAVADFSLVVAPMGVSIMSVERNTDTTATLTLAFDGTDFDSDMAIGVTVLATAHSGTADLVSRLITITANQEASGEPSITGTPQVGVTLTATIGSITDGNGLNTANYAWQWQVSDDGNTWTDIPGANTADFIPALTHQDQFLRVVAGFTDDDGFRESRTSTSVGPVSEASLILRLKVFLEGAQ